jgi:hypothetical protein
MSLTSEIANLRPLELVGIFGFLLYVVNYSLLTFRVTSSEGLTFFVINLAASSAVLAGLMVSFNLAAALIQIFWITISLVAITLRLFRRTTLRPYIREIKP